MDFYDEEDFLFDTDKVNALFSDNGEDMKKFTANVLIGHIPAERLNNHVGETFTLSGFFCKQRTFQDGKTGNITTIFGKQNEPCAFTTTSEKVLTSLKMISYAYGKPESWNDSIQVAIKMEEIKKSDGQTVNVYSLEVV